MALSWIDWAIVAGYVAFALWTGLRFARRAGRDVDQYFLSGRALPWWVAGTSMIATSFAADTPLVITRWVRDDGVWRNWLWWCFAIGNVLTIFLFARYWRRGEVMTTAELVELRYGGRGARRLRGLLGIYHAAIKNTWVLCWVMLAGVKILDVVLGVDALTSVVALALIAFAYCVLSGFWGVVVTDVVQFVMAAVGAVVLAVLCWSAVGGMGGLAAALDPGSGALDDRFAFLPTPGAGGPLEPAFWTAPVASVAVLLGLAWLAVESVDGGSIIVQRIAACRDERQGALAVLWYCVGHYSLRPWPWILVALASLAVLPPIEVRSPARGAVVEVSEGHVRVEGEAGAWDVPLEAAPGHERWSPRAVVELSAAVEEGQVLARTDSERAYPVMMVEFLPVGLLGLAVASLLAAFMSTIDTHVNLAASFFVNDVYRRFLQPDAGERHYVGVARLASAVVLLVGAALAYVADSISDLFTLFLSFLAGVGPVYVLRWLWWRVRAETEMAAMIASGVSAVALTYLDVDWRLGPLSPGGELTHEGRLCLVVAVALASALGSLVLVRRPDPAGLVDFYRRVRPLGWWGPVRALAGEVRGGREVVPVVVGFAGGLAAVYGVMLGLGLVLLERGGEGLAALAVAAVGVVASTWALRRLFGAAAGG